MVRSISCISKLPDKSGITIKKRDDASVKRVSNGLNIDHSVGIHQKFVHWSSKPKNILILKKPQDVRTVGALQQIFAWFKRNEPDTNLIVERSAVDEVETSQLENTNIYTSYLNSDEDRKQYARVVDFVITLGGDGTILHASDLFQKTVPPILSFSLGTINFLVPFGKARS